MNIIQIHNRIKFWVDETSSARFDAIDIDQAINSTIDLLTEELSDAKRQNHKLTFIQSDEKTRQKLHALIKPKVFSAGDLSGNSILISALPEYFQYFLSLEAIDSDGNIYIVYPMDYNSEKKIEKNPYLRSKVGMVNLAYYNEETDKIRIILPDGKTLSSVNSYYFEKPVTVKYGISYTHSKSFTADDVVIVESSTVEYNSTIYGIGEEITIVTGHLNITSGTVVFGYINTNLHQLAHEEIAKISAESLLRSVDEHEKTEYIKRDNISN